MGSQVSLAVALVLWGWAANAQPSQTTAPEDAFRNYALSTCLADGYTAEEVRKDAAAAARGYLEFGALPLEAHTEATKLAREFLQRDYPSSTGERLVLMKCLDFSRSKELQGVYRKYRRRK